VDIEETMSSSPVPIAQQAASPHPEEEHRLAGLNHASVQVPSLERKARSFLGGGQITGVESLEQQLGVLKRTLLRDQRPSSSGNNKLSNHESAGGEEGQEPSHEVSAPIICDPIRHK